MVNLWSETKVHPWDFFPAIPEPIQSHQSMMDTIKAIVTAMEKKEQLTHGK